MFSLSFVKISCGGLDLSKTFYQDHDGPHQQVDGTEHYLSPNECQFPLSDAPANTFC